MTDSQLSMPERKERGRQARSRTPLAAHTGWTSPDRDPVALLIEQNTTREPDLVPVRHGRMLVSPFTFYRGAAKVMAADLATTATSGLITQLCGDAHLSNFGGFGSPERQLIFGLNDFDETLPGPFEYDVKRMAASFTIAARNNGHPVEEQRTATMTAVTAYRTAMREFARMGALDVWYAHLSDADLVTAIRDYAATSARGEHSSAGGSKKKKKRDTGRHSDDGKGRKAQVKAAEKNIRKARSRDNLQALAKLTVVVDGQHRIVSQPPVLIPARDLRQRFGMSTDQVHDMLEGQLKAYRATLPEDRRHLLDQYEIVDFARKVVGVGSVGTRAFIVLLQGRAAHDPLFLQVKEATSSVLEDHLPRSRFDTPGERVVRGQRMLQAASDIFLGWITGTQPGRYYYCRQLRDMKGSAIVEEMSPAGLAFYARVCGWTLAHAHARSGDPVAIASYLGSTDRFDHAITEFSGGYADQNEQDYSAFVKAVRSGRIAADQGV